MIDPIRMPKLFDKARSKLKGAYGAYVPSAAIPGMQTNASYPTGASQLRAEAEPQPEPITLKCNYEARYSYQTTSTSNSYQSSWSQQSSLPPSCPLPSLPSLPSEI